jgi:enoyl-CoA hydratase/carnithine racemase
LTPPGFARITTGDLFPPDEAMRFGYLDRVLEAGQLGDAVRAEAHRLRQLDMPSFAATKARVNAHALDAIRAAADGELRAVAA